MKQLENHRTSRYIQIMEQRVERFCRCWRLGPSKQPIVGTKHLFWASTCFNPFIYSCSSPLGCGCQGVLYFFHCNLMISTPLHAVYLYILYQPVEYHWAFRHILYLFYHIRSCLARSLEVASLTQAYFKISERSRSFTDELFAALLAENLVEIGWTHMETWVF